MKFEKNIFIQYLLGVVFIASGITKLMSFDEFQIFIYSLNIVNLNFSLALSRIIIAIELSLGLLYFVRIFKKPVSYITLALMIIFTVFAFYLEFSNKSDDCHCFGTIIQFSNTATILKNFVIIILVIYSLVYGRQKKNKYDLLIVACTLFVAFGATIVVRPPDLTFATKSPTEEYFHKPSFDKFVTDNNLNDQKRVICFFSFKCKYCQFAAKKMSIIAERANNTHNILYVFWETDNNIDDFFKETKTHSFETKDLNVIEFLKLTNGKMPLIILYNNGVIEHAYRYKDMDESQIIRFLQE